MSISSHDLSLPVFFIFGSLGIWHLRINLHELRVFFLLFLNVNAPKSEVYLEINRAYLELNRESLIEILL